MNQKGFSLIEIVAASLLLALGIGLAIYSFKGMTVTEMVGAKKMATTNSVFSTLRFIQKIGRASQLCRRKVVGGNDALECDIDFSRPSDGSLEWIRFVVVNQALEYQKDKNNDGNFTEVVTQLQYPDVVKFELCDDTIMAAGTCTIQPSAISTFHNNYLLAGKDNRFFRFSLTSVSISMSGKPASSQPKDLFNVVHQGAFYRRNPTPFAPAVFQW